jgi:outer membrane protein OmpA-like peptidoglycan-associated protein
MKTRSSSILATLALAGFLAGCAGAVPRQLAEARSAYLASEQGLASKLTPTELHDAKKALDNANKEFAENGDSPECRDYSYVAHRKIQLTDAKARTAQDRQNIAEAAKAGVVVRDAQMKTSQAALASSREQLETQRRANEAQGKELASSAAQLDTEKQARLSAEGKLAGAMKDLAAISAVREEARGVVITLSGSVLFASGKYTLLNTAKTKLDQVAEALKAQDDDKRMIVEGHTDSQGSDSLNQTLSLNRATAVRNYLVSKGVDAGKIVAEGVGEAKPITDNNTAENRANNRRVEIVIAPTKVHAG